MKIFKNKKAIRKSSKTTPVLIRFDVEDLRLIKEAARLEGLPYQTYIKSMIHKKISKEGK